MLGYRFYKFALSHNLYFDTPVLGGVYNIEFEKAPVQLFKKVKLGQIICIYSYLSEGELFDAPEKVKIFQKPTQNKFRSC